MRGDLKINKQILIFQVVVSALKNKAEKTIENDNIGGDATLHGMIREGPEQRAARSEGVRHADTGGRAL